MAEETIEPPVSRGRRHIPMSEMDINFKVEKDEIPWLRQSIWEKQNVKVG